MRTGENDPAFDGDDSKKDPSVDHDLQRLLKRFETMRERTKAAEAAVEAEVIKRGHQKRPCPEHGGDQRPYREAMVKHHLMTGMVGETLWLPCPVCNAAEQSQKEQAFLARRGVPGKLLACSFGNWDPKRQHGDEGRMQMALDFAMHPKGFLLMVGDVGCGKSHLAVSIMRRARVHCVFMSTYMLMHRLRGTYRNDKALSPVDECMSTKLLVLDDLQPPKHGKDEIPAVETILLSRLDNDQATVITTNVSKADLAATFDGRLIDRLWMESQAVPFKGESQR